MLAPSESGDNDFIGDFDALTAEVEAFDEDLAARPKVVALNKADLSEASQAEPELRQMFERKGLTFFFISAATGQGLDALKKQLGELVQKNRAQ